MNNNTCSIQTGTLATLKWGEFMDVYFNKMAKCLRDYIDYQNAMISSSYINNVNTDKSGNPFCGSADSYRHKDGLPGYCGTSASEMPPFLKIVCDAIQPQASSSDILKKYRKNGTTDILNLEILNFVVGPNKDIFNQFMNLYNNNLYEFIKSFYFYVVPIFYFDIDNIKKGILKNTILKEIIDQGYLIPNGFYQVIQKQLTIKESPDHQPFEVLKFILKYILLTFVNVEKENEQKQALIKMYNYVNNLTYEETKRYVIKIFKQVSGYNAASDKVESAVNTAATTIKDAASSAATTISSAATTVHDAAITTRDAIRNYDYRQAATNVHDAAITTRDAIRNYDYRQAATNVVEAVRHPMETAHAVENRVLGAIFDAPQIDLTGIPEDFQEAQPEVQPAPPAVVAQLPVAAAPAPSFQSTNNRRRRLEGGRPEEPPLAYQALETIRNRANTFQFTLIDYLNGLRTLLADQNIIPGLSAINAFEQYYTMVPSMNILGIYGTQLLFDMIPDAFKTIPKNDSVISFFQVLSQNCHSDLREALTPTNENQTVTPDDITQHNSINIKVSKCLKNTINTILKDSLKFIFSQPISILQAHPFDHDAVSKTISDTVTNKLFPETEKDTLKKALSNAQLISNEDVNKGLLEIIIKHKNELQTNGRRMRRSGPSLKEKINALYPPPTGNQNTSKIIEVAEELFKKEEKNNEVGAFVDNIKTFIKGFNLVPLELETAFNETFNIIKVVYKQFAESLGLELFLYQFFGAFYTALCNPKSELYKSISSKNVIDLLIALIRLFKNNLPTTVHKILQMVDPRIKATDFGPSYVYWLGPKLVYPVMGNIEVDIIQDQLIKQTSKQYVKLGDFITTASVGQVYRLNQIKTDELLTKIFIEFENLMNMDINYPFMNHEFRKYVYKTKLNEIKYKSLEILSVQLPNLSTAIIPIYECLKDVKLRENLLKEERAQDLFTFLIKIMKIHNKDIDIDIAYDIANPKFKIFVGQTTLEPLQAIENALKKELERQPQNQPAAGGAHRWNELIDTFLDREEIQKKRNFNISNFSGFIMYLKLLVNDFLKKEGPCFESKKHDLHLFSLELSNLETKLLKYNQYDNLFRKSLDALDKQELEPKFGSKQNLIAQIPSIYNLITNLILEPFKLNDLAIKFIKIRNRMMMCLEKQVFPGSISQILRDRFYNKIADLNTDEKALIKTGSIYDLDETFQSQIKPNEINAYNYLMMAYKLLDCKIKDVLDEFDLWQEIVQTMKAYKLYTYNTNYREPGVNYRVITADVKQTFKHIEGFQEKPEYVDEFGESVEVSHMDEDFKQKLIQDQKLFQRRHYIAVIQTFMIGKDIVNIENIKGLPQKELECLQQAFNFFISQFLNGIIHTGRYHGDPHGGNLKWHYNSEYEKGTLSVIDFGDFPEISFKYRTLVLGLVCSGALTFMLNDHNKPSLLNYITDFLLNSYGFQNYEITELEDIYRKNIDNDYETASPTTLQQEINLKYFLTKSINHYFEMEIKRAIEIKYANIGKKSSILESLATFTQDDTFIELLIGRIEVSHNKCESVSSDIKKVVLAVLKLFNTAELIGGLDLATILLTFVKLNVSNLGPEAQRMYDVMNMLKGPLQMFKLLKNTTGLKNLDILKVAIGGYMFIPSIAFSIGSSIGGWVLNKGWQYITDEKTSTSQKVIIGAVAAVIATVVAGIAWYQQKERTNKLVEDSTHQLLSIQSKSSLELFSSTLVNSLIFIIVDGLQTDEVREIHAYIKEYIQGNKEKKISPQITDADNKQYVWNSSLYPEQLNGFVAHLDLVFGIIPKVLKPAVSMATWLNKKTFQLANWGFKTFYIDYTKVNSISNHKENTHSITDPSATNILKYKKILSKKSITADKYLLTSDSVLYLKTLIGISLDIDYCMKMLKKYKSNLIHYGNTELTIVDEEDIKNLKPCIDYTMDAQEIRKFFEFKHIGEDILGLDYDTNFREVLGTDETFASSAENWITIAKMNPIKLKEIKCFKVKREEHKYEVAKLNDTHIPTLKFMIEIIARVSYNYSIYEKIFESYDYVKMIYKQKKEHQEQIIIKLVMLYQFMKLKKTIYPDILYTCLVELSTFAYKNTIKNNENPAFNKYNDDKERDFIPDDYNISSSVYFHKKKCFNEIFEINFEFWQFDFGEIISHIKNEKMIQQMIQSVGSFLEKVSHNIVYEYIKMDDICKLRTKLNTPSKMSIRLDEQVSGFEQTHLCKITKGLIQRYDYQKANPGIFNILTHWDEFSFLLSIILDENWPLDIQNCVIKLPEINDPFTYKPIVNKWDLAGILEKIRHFQDALNKQSSKPSDIDLENYKMELMKFICYININELTALKQAKSTEYLKNTLLQLYEKETRNEGKRRIGKAIDDWADNHSYYTHGPTLSGNPPDASNRDDIIIEVRDVLSHEEEVEVNHRKKYKGTFTTENLPFTFERLPRMNGEGVKQSPEILNNKIITANGRELSDEEIQKANLPKFIYKNKLSGDRLNPGEQQVEINFQERYTMTEINSLAKLPKLADDYEKKIQQLVVKPAMEVFPKKEKGWWPFSGGRRSSSNRQNQTKKRSKRPTNVNK
jgi:hypothetical protein